MPIIREDHQQEILTAMAHMTWTLLCATTPSTTPYAKSINKIITNPVVGDLVLETSTLHPELRKETGNLIIGRLVEIIDDPQGGKTYIIDRVNGSRERWSNASFVVVLEKALHEYEDRG